MDFTHPLKDGLVCFTKSKTEAVVDTFEIRTVMLCSLGAQTILTIFCNRRRYRLSFFTRILVWLSYLIAAPVGILALGKFSGMTRAAYEIKEQQLEENFSYELYGTLISWCVPLLLVHICSPNIITYSVEDNKLMLRQVVGLTSIGVISLWILYGSWFQNKYQVILMVPLYVVSMIKFGYRLRGLRLLSKSEDVVKSTFANSDIREGEISKEPSSCSELIVSGSFSDCALLMKAYQRFDRLKPYLKNWLGHTSSVNLPSMSINNYLSEDVFRITEFELSFMYDALYTRTPINYSKRSFLGRIICIALLALLLCIVLFVIYLLANHMSQFPILVVDSTLSFVLLAGAIVLEIYEIKELLYSDWAIVHMMELNKSAFIRRLLRIVAPKTPRKKHRWSHCMDQLNLISYCVYKEPTKLGRLIWKIPKIKGYDKEYKKYCVKKDIQVPEELKKLILQQMDEVRPQRGWQPFYKCGEWTLERCNCLQDLKWSIHEDFGIQANKQTNFGKTIIMWHIATTVCYHSEDSQSQGTITHPQCEMSKVLSDYMMYILAMHPDMLYIVTGDILFCGVCAQVGEFLKTKKPRDEATLCRMLLDESVDENYQQGNPKNVLTSKWNVVFQVQKLVGILRGREDRWRIISSVWVEMLCYVATNCPWTLHAEQLRRGGELLTHVWLLLEHEKDEANFQSLQMQYDA